MLDDFDNKINVEDMIPEDDLVIAFTSCLTTSMHMISHHEDLINLETGEAIEPQNEDVLKLERAKKED